MRLFYFYYVYNYCRNDFAVLMVITNTAMLYAEQRKETNTITDFLAACGSLLGLFLGISALSIIELIYYVTLHLYWIVRRA